MKKVTYKATILETIEALKQLHKEEGNIKIRTEVSAVRSGDFNKYYQALMRFVASETGEVDFDNLPREIAEKEFEKFKRRLKSDLGYYIEYVVETKNGENITKEYISTSDMNTKQLMTFIAKIETLILTTYPEVNFEFIKKKSQED